MFITICKSKINHATVTEAELYYEGSITIDEDIIKAADIIAGEKVEVLNLNTGSRIETYVIAGKAGSGQICLNGPAARSGHVGDKIIVLSYAMIDKKEAPQYKTKVVYLNDKNSLKN